MYGPHRLSLRGGREGAIFIRLETLLETELGIGQTHSAATGLTVEYPKSNFSLVVSVLLKVRQFSESDSRWFELKETCCTDCTCLPGRPPPALYEQNPFSLASSLSFLLPSGLFQAHCTPAHPRHLYPVHGVTPVPKAERKYCYLWCSRRVILIKTGYEAMNDR